MEYLHLKRPEEVPLLRFRPISTSRIKAIRSKKRMKGEDSEKRNYIKDEDFNKIIKALDSEMVPVVQLGYYYGLRRSEILALYDEPNRVRKGYLLIDKQLMKVTNGDPVHKPTKNRLFRKINHWFCSVSECYDLVNKLTLLNPDRATRLFDKAVRGLLASGAIKEKYELQDLRHTYITKAVELYNVNDVARCVGHHDISVTNGYLKDSRVLEDDVFIPQNEASRP